MAAPQLLFIFSHSPDHELAEAAWDAAMTAGLLNQAVTVLFSGAGLKQLKSQNVLDKIAMLKELFPLRLCIESGDTADSAPDLEQELVSPSSTSEFFRDFHRILSF